MIHIAKILIQLYFPFFIGGFATIFSGLQQANGPSMCIQEHLHTKFSTLEEKGQELAA